MPTEAILHNIRKSIETWDMDLMKQSLGMALNKEIRFEEIVSSGIQPGMETINERFNRGEIFLPQIVAAAKVVDEALRMSGPPSMENMFKGTIVMGSVFGDIHEIGKNVCCAMLRGSGFKVIDLGSDVSPDRFVEKAEEAHADIIGGSALMTTTLSAQKKMVESMKESGYHALMIFGGAPCTKEWVDSIDGDGYSSSASEIVQLAIELLDRNRS